MGRPERRAQAREKQPEPAQPGFRTIGRLPKRARDEVTRRDALIRSAQQDLSNYVAGVLDSMGLGVKNDGTCRYNVIPETGEVQEFKMPTPVDLPQ